MAGMFGVSPGVALVVISPFTGATRGGPTTRVSLVTCGLR